MKKALQFHKSVDKNKMTPEQVVEFLEDFSVLMSGQKLKGKTKLISIKLEEPLLIAFRAKADSLHVPYQTQMKLLMKEWLRK